MRGAKGRERRSLRRAPTVSVLQRSQLSAIGVFAGLAGLILLAYSPLITTETGLLWDDSGHITRPELRATGGLWRIWFEIGATQQYYPVVHSAFWLQARLWGDNLTAYHLVSVLLHACSAILLTIGLRRLAVPGALFAGAIFALHPVHVESVAWISELKNTLSMVFFLASGLAYLGFDRARGRGSYIVSIGLFALAVLSKSVTATLPVGLLVVLWWRRERLEWRRDVLPLLPFLVIGTLGGVLTMWFERVGIGAEGAEFALTPIERALIAGRAVVFYVSSLLWPMHLSFNYPRWQVDQAVWWQYLFPSGVIAVFAALWWRRARGAVAALAFFCVTAGPALGFVNVYPFRFSFVADHFQYHASLGILAFVAAALATMVVTLGWSRGVALGGAVLITSALGLGTYAQAAHYVDAPTLYRATIASNPGSWLAHNNLATILATEGGDPRLAADHARAALALRPDYIQARYNLALALEQQGAFDPAIAEYRAVLRQAGAEATTPTRLASTHLRLGVSLRSVGRLGEATAELERAVALDGSRADAHGELGMSLAQAGRTDAALPHFEQAVALDGASAIHRTNLGTALLQLGRPDEAVGQLTEAVRLEPTIADAHYNLGAALSMLGRYTEGAAAFREALRLRPDDPRARAALQFALARIK